MRIRDWRSDVCSSDLPPDSWHIVSILSKCHEDADAEHMCEIPTEPHGGDAVTGPRTLYDKIWDAHAVAEDDGETLLYIDLHLLHEVTSPDRKSTRLTSSH